MMKVLHVLTDTNIGGAGRLLVNYLHSRGGALTDTAVVLPWGAALAEALAAENVRVIFVKNGADSSFDLKAVFEYRRLFARERPDAVVTHASMSARIAAKLAGVPRKIYVRHCVNDGGGRRVSGVVKRMLRRAADDFLTDAVIATADAARDALIDAGVRADKITTVINGVAPLEKFTPEQREKARASYGFAADDFVFIAAARLEAVKNLDIIIHAAALAHKTDARIKLLVAGTGSLEGQLKAQARAECDGAVVFAGFVPDVTTCFNAADATVNASSTETSSLSLSEGMSLGLPAIAVAKDGNAHMVLNGVNGLTANGGMDEKMTALASDGEMYRRLSDGARARYEAEFTSAAMARKWDEIILG